MPHSRTPGLLDLVQSTTRILAIGSLGPVLKEVEDRAPAELIRLSYEGFSGQGSLPTAADVVFAPLLGPTFDILDVGARLTAMGFRGALRAVSPHLPNPGAIATEVRAHFRDLDFDLLTTGQTA